MQEIQDEQQEQEDVIYVEAHEFGEYTKAILQAGLQGYTLSDKASYYPQNLGGLIFRCTLVRDNAAKDDSQARPRGRPRKEQ